jgi:serine/threonine protein kinase
LKLNEEDIELVQHDLHLTRVAIATSLIKLGCSITKEDKNRVTPWREVAKVKDEELQKLFLESEHIHLIRLESKRFIYIDYSNSLSSADADVDSDEDQDDCNAEVYVGFFENELEMQAVKCFLLASPKAEKRFVTEVDNMKSVKGGNHVVKYIDCAIVKPKGREKFKLGYIVMEKARYTVKDVIDRREGVTKDDEAEEAFRINILLQTVDAIIYLHKKDSILHRDLKPDNIFVVEDERLVVFFFLIINMVH